jgi:GntR family transcriptional regulator
MLLHVNAGSGVPIHLQIEQQIKHAIASRALTPGEALPSIRKTASELRVNPNTVARAFSDLERDGLLRMVPGGGTFVAEVQPSLLKAERLRRLRPIATQLAVEASQLRVSAEDVRKLVDAALEEFGGEQ